VKLVLIRHGESVWNRENLFTGWTDVELSDAGKMEARDAGRLLRDGGYDFDVCYTSYLKRAIHTLDIALDQLDRAWLPVVKDWRLNERHYGALQGLNKAETAAKYGEEQVRIWRRAFDVRPPVLEEADGRSPRLQAMYRGGDAALLPLAESLKDTVARVIPYFENIIKRDILNGKRVLVAAHGNSIRALVKYFEDISNSDIVEVNIPTGVPLVYEFDGDFKVMNKYYLGDEAAIKDKMNQVANQGAAK